MQTKRIIRKSPDIYFSLLFLSIYVFIFLGDNKYSSRWYRILFFMFFTLRIEQIGFCYRSCARLGVWYHVVSNRPRFIRFIYTQSYSLSPSVILVCIQVHRPHYTHSYFSIFNFSISILKFINFPTHIYPIHLRTQWLEKDIYPHIYSFTHGHFFILFYTQLFIHTHN